MIRIGSWLRYIRLVNGAAETLVDIKRGDISEGFKESIITIKSGTKKLKSVVQKGQMIWRKHTKNT